MTYVVAIDGPAGAGKSTIAKLVAKELNAIYVDTGAMYRAMALYMLRNGLTAKDNDCFGDMCQNADISIRFVDGIQNVFLNGENVNGLIRTEEVGNMASKVSANIKVREKLVDLQRKLAQGNDVVMDGRDIGTNVLPDAKPKIYLTASSGVRAKRRYDELKAKGENCDITAIEQDIIARDHQDMTREISPLKQAEDAILVDSSDMTIEEVKDSIVALIYSANE
ncbi:MAG: (d)CMP kinase [Lachnospiraceae bacterium]